MRIATSVSWGEAARNGLLLAAVAVLGLPAWTGAQSAPAGSDVTYSKDIAPILRRSCENCHRPGGGGTDVDAHVRGGPAMGSRHQAAHRHRTPRRRDAAVVHGKEHRHPEVQGRPVTQRQRGRDHREVGRQRGATRQPGRCATSEGVGRQLGLAHRDARPHRQEQGHPGEGELARLVGRDSRPCRFRSTRIGTWPPSRSRK